MFKKFISLLLLGAAIWLHHPTSAEYCNYPRPGYWTTNGVVRDIRTYDGTIYIAGDFTYVGPMTGGGAAFSTEDPGYAYSSFPAIDGDVRAIQRDGSGGFYIGGYFSSVGYEPRSNVAHLLSNGTVDPNFNIAVNGQVWSIAISPDQKTLYIGGEFTEVGGSPFKKFAAISLDTCSIPVQWTTPIELNNTVKAVAASPDGSTIYIGGAFTAPLNRLAAVKSTDGTLLTAWNPSPDSYVNSLQVSGGGIIYAGGDFKTIGGVSSVKYLAKINSNGGVDPSFAPTINSYVSRVLLSADGNTLRICGPFNKVGDADRRHIAFLNTSDGTLLPWTPPLVNAEVYDIATSADENTLFICGKFTTVSLSKRNYLAAIDIPSDTVRDWNPGAENEVFAIGLSSDGALLYAGGDFVSAGGGFRSRLAAIDVVTNTLRDWNPNANGSVQTIDLSYDGKSFYAGGGFTSIGGGDRNRIAQIDRLSGYASTWNPNADNVVRTIRSSTDGSTIYVGGLFKNIGGTPRNYLAALSPDTGNATSWNPYPDNIVSCIRVSPNNQTVYTAGNFQNIGYQKNSYIAAISALTGNSESEDWTASANVHTLYLSSNGNTLYAGGEFTSICGQNRNRIAAITTSNVKPTVWNPNANNTVLSIGFSYDGKLAYAAGSFTSIGGQTRNYAAILNASSNTATSWDPNPNNSTLAIVTSEDESILFAGGSFTKVGGQQCQYLAGFKSGEFHLTVENGSGDGNYTEGYPVTIQADIPPLGNTFDKWTGATSHLANPSSSTTTVTMPDSDISVKANYKLDTYIVTFYSSGHGTISGTSPQTVSYGKSTKSVKAVPETDYKFDKWTGTGGFESTSNPLVIKNVTMDMEVMANFVPGSESATLTINSDGNGTTNPWGDTTVMVNRPLQIKAEPKSGYYFSHWTADANPQNVDISNASSMSTTVTITGAATITANFNEIPDEAHLTVDVLPELIPPPGTTTPSGTTTVAGGTQVELTAIPANGYYFLEWTYSSGAAIIANCLESTTYAVIYDDVTVTANFIGILPQNNVTFGKIYGLNVSDVAGLANFARAPQAYCQYVDPVSQKTKKARLRNLTKIPKEGTGATSMEWASKFPLLSTKIWSQNKYNTVMEILASNIPNPPPCRLFAKGQDTTGIKTDGYVQTTIDLYQIQPAIYGAYDEYGNKITAAGAGQKIIIQGSYFGKSVPQIWVEYKDKKGVVKKKTLKVERKLLNFPDYRGKPGKYCMDIYTGESELTVYMPSKWPNSWTHIGNHNIVIDNKICRATTTFWTMP